MRDFLRNNSLSIAMLLFFALSVVGQTATGFAESNDDREKHGELRIGLGAYLGSGHFIEAVFENWESEFLQMGIFVVLTVWLRQRGSSESKPLEGDQPVDRDADPDRPHAPWPVSRGGLALRIYEHSLGIALFLLFGLSFILHAVGGAAEYNEEQGRHGSAERATAVTYLATTRFWFESLQNWQSEFMSVGALVVLSIFLREKGSPESKPVDHPHAETGSE